MLEALKNRLDDLQIDVVGKWWFIRYLSGSMVLLSWLLVVAIGPNWGIDFTGGTEIHVAFDDPVDIGELRSALVSLGLADDSVQSVGGSIANEFAINIQDPEFGMGELVEAVESALVTGFGEDWIQNMEVSTEVGARITVDYAGPSLEVGEVADALEAVEGVSVQSGREENQVVVTVPGLSQLIEREISVAIGDRAFQVLAVDAVGPKVGGDLRRQGMISVLLTLALVLVYIGFRFEPTYGPPAIMGLVHDVSLVLGIFVVLQLEFNLAMIGALLTIVGYSLNNTIVIFDRIRENRSRYRRNDLVQLINESVSETLARTAATSVTTFTAIMAFLLFGGPVIRNFALAMSLGIVFGTFSTIYVASPMVLVMENLKPWFSKFIALGPTEQPSDGPGEGEEDEEGGAQLTESEKRRRARAEAEQRESLS